MFMLSVAFTLSQGWRLRLWAFSAQIQASLSGVHHGAVQTVSRWCALPHSVHLRLAGRFRFCRYHSFFGLSNAVEPLLFVEGITGLEGVRLQLSSTTKHHSEKVLGWMRTNRV